MSVTRYVILLALLLLVIANASSVFAQQPTVKVLIEPGKDGVLLNVEASYTSKSETASPGAFALILDTQYRESEKTLHIKFATKFIMPIVTSATAGPYTQPSKNKKMSLKLGGTFSSGNGTGFSIIKGELVTENGTATFVAIVKSKSGDNYGVVSIRADVTVEKSLIPPDMLKQLSLIEITLTPELVNAQLAKQNLTWMKFTELRLVHEEKTKAVVFRANATMEIDYNSMFKQLGITNTSLVRKLLELQKSIEQKGTFSMHLGTTSTHISMYLDMKAVMKGDIEEYARLQSQYFAMLYTSSAPPEVLADLKPWLELVILPWNTSLSFTVSSTSAGEVHVDLALKDLRIGHIALRGEEAQKRVAELLLTLLEAAKSSGIPIEYTTSIAGAKPSTELLPIAKKVLKAAIHGEIKPKYMKNVPFMPPPPPVATATRTYAATTITLTIPTKTTAPAVVISVITKTVPKMITVMKSLTVTHVLTLLKTVTQTLTKTIELTVTKSVTQLRTTTVTTTITQTSTTPIAIGLAIAAIGIAIAVIGRRRL